MLTAEGHRGREGALLGAAGRAAESIWPCFDKAASALLARGSLTKPNNTCRIGSMAHLRSGEWRQLFETVRRPILQVRENSEKLVLVRSSFRRFPLFYALHDFSAALTLVAV